VLVLRAITPQCLLVRRALSLCARAALLTACSADVPPLADARLAAADGAEQVQAVYVAPASDDCAGAHLAGAAAVQGGLVLTESTCVAEAGGDDTEPHLRLVRVHADGVEELPLPPGVSSNEGVRVLGASSDGEVYVRVDDVAAGATELWRLQVRDGWQRLTEPARLGDHHRGDGGPASAAVVENPLDVEVGDDGVVHVLEPHAVRRIGTDGVIETVAGSDRDDPPVRSDYAEWGSGGTVAVQPDPHALPSGPVRAVDFPLPRLTAMDVADDGTVWLASHDAVLRLAPDGVLTLHADAGTVQPDARQAALVGSRGSSSSISDIVAVGGSLLLVDDWSGRVLRLDGQGLRLVLGRPEEERASCPPPVLGEALAPTRVCASALVARPDGSVLVVHDPGVLAVPRAALTRGSSLA
jgi:hypothetical protein